MELPHRRVQLRFVVGQVDAFVDAEQLDAFIAAVASSTDPKAAQLLAIVERAADEVDQCPMCKSTGWAVTSGDVMFRCPTCTPDEVDEVQAT